MISHYHDLFFEGFAALSAIASACVLSGAQGGRTTLEDRHCGGGAGGSKKIFTGSGPENGQGLIGEEGALRRPPCIGMERNNNNPTPA